MTTYTRSDRELHRHLAEITTALKAIHVGIRDIADVLLAQEVTKNEEATLEACPECQGTTIGKSEFFGQEPMTVCLTCGNEWPSL